MTLINPQLVEQITREVLKALGSPAPASSPPAGMCTAGAPTTSPEPGASTPTPQRDQPPALTGIITARQLEDALAEAEGGPVRLAASARLSPLAADFARLHPARIERVAATDGNGAVSQGRPWLLYAESMLPSVRAVRERGGSSVTPMPAGRGERGLLEAVQRIGTAVRHATATGGVLFTQTPQVAVVYANHHPMLRGCVFHDDKPCAARDRLAPNVLIMSLSVSESVAQAVVRHAFSKPPAADALTRRALAELQA